MDDKKHTSAQYDLDLQEVREKLLYMGAVVERAIMSSLEALVRRDSDLARRVVADDILIDQMDVEVEEKCIRLLALRQPAAGDLRFITTAIKINGHLERIGDMAVNIAERVLPLNEEPQIKHYIDLPRMAEITRGMVRGSLEAFLKEDIGLANRVRLEDETIDQLNEQIFRELLTYMMEDPKKIHASLLIMQIAKNLERMADHAEGIADMVVYMVTGKTVRHGRSAPNGP